MKKLIKISNYRYVVEYTELTKDDYSVYISNIIKGFLNPNSVIEKGNKILATTNPSIPLPQISNPIEELELMVGKEVEVELFSENKGKIFNTEYIIILPCSPHNNSSNSDMSIYKATIKPISEETSTETLEEISFNTFRDTIGLLMQAGLSNEHSCKKIIQNAIEFGYKHCEKTLYTEEQLQAEICKHNSQTIENCKQAMYSEDEVLKLLSNYREDNQHKMNCGAMFEEGAWFNSNKK